MKQKSLDKNIVLIYVVSALLLALIFGAIAHQMYTEYVANTSDYIIRYSFTGIENLFHDRYEYYSINGNNIHNISSYVKESGNIEEFESVSRYEDTDSRWIRIDSNENFEVLYNKEGTYTTEEEELFKKILKHFETFEEFQDMEMLTLYITNHDNTYLIEYCESTIYKVNNPFSNDMSITKLMDCPKNGYFDYVYWIK